MTGVQTCALPICKDDGSISTIIDGNKYSAYNYLYDIQFEQVQERTTTSGTTTALESYVWGDASGNDGKLKLLYATNSGTGTYKEFVVPDAVDSWVSNSGVTYDSDAWYIRTTTDGKAAWGVAELSYSQRELFYVDSAAGSGAGSIAACSEDSSSLSSSLELEE